MSFIIHILADKFQPAEMPGSCAGMRLLYSVVTRPTADACCRGAGQGPSDAGLTSAQFSLAYERHERVGKISAANAAQKTLVPGACQVLGDWPACSSVLGGAVPETMPCCL